MYICHQIKANHKIKTKTKSSRHVFVRIVLNVKVWLSIPIKTTWHISNICIFHSHYQRYFSRVASKQSSIHFAPVFMRHPQAIVPKKSQKWYKTIVKQKKIESFLYNLRICIKQKHHYQKSNQMNQMNKLICIQIQIPRIPIIDIMKIRSLKINFNKNEMSLTQHNAKPMSIYDPIHSQKWEVLLCRFLSNESKESEN